MKFGWINFFNLIILILMMIPNIIYSFKYKNKKNKKNKCKNVLMNILEQIGRYSCMFLMVFPLVVWKFGYASVIEAVIYFISNILLIIIYWIFFFIYMKNKSNKLAIILAILPKGIFILNGVLLRHWLLVGFAILFGISHIYVTNKNN